MWIGNNIYDNDDERAEALADGKIWVGDDPDIEQATECRNRITDSGSYECWSPMTG